MGVPTPNIGLTLPTNLGDQNNWGPEVNGDFSLLDLMLGGFVVVPVAGGANIIPTLQQAQAFYQRLTGALTGNISYLLPPGLAGFRGISNETTGAFSAAVAVSNGGSGPLGTGVVVPQGGRALVYSDGTNVVPIQDPTVRARFGANYNSITTLANTANVWTALPGAWVTGSGLPNQGGGFNQGTGVFTAPSAGDYLFSYSCTFLAPTTGSSVSLALAKNGINTFRFALSGATQLQTQQADVAISGAQVVTLAAGDTVQMAFVTTGAGWQVGLANLYLSGVQLA